MFHREVTDKDIIRSKEIFKTLPPGKKVAYVFEYYKLVLILIAIAVVVLVYGIYHHFHPQPDTIANVTLVEAAEPIVYSQSETVTVFDQYLADNGYDPEEEELDVVVLDSTTYTMQLLMARLMTGEIDLIIGDEDNRDMLDEQAALLELESVLPAELLEERADDLFISEDPETGEEHVYAILLPEGNELMQEGYYADPVWAGITYTSENAEAAASVLEYLLLYGN